MWNGFMASENTILVGSKPIRTYVTVGMSLLKNTNLIIIKARGKIISRAVDVAELLKRSVTEGKIVVKDITISTETVTREDGRTNNVSAIEITLEKVAE